jgi:hypothetical protein
MSFIQDLVKKQLSIWFPDKQIIENYRPDWLVGLEIDLYLPELKLAVEVNGLQHYVKIDKFFKTESQFEMQLIRDHVKKKILENENIKLISVKQGFNMFKELLFKINYISKSKLKPNAELSQQAKDHWLNKRDDYLPILPQEKRVDLLEEEHMKYNFLIKNKNYKEAYSFIKDRATIVDKKENSKLSKIYGKNVSHIKNACNTL